MAASASAEEPVDLKKIMAVARRCRINFAISVKGKDVALLADIKRKPKALRKEARGLVAGSPKGVRCQSFWNQERPKLRESLAHLVGLIMRRVVGDASVALRASFV